ncbi:MAG: bacterioferritin-associated ferredoxin [Thiolinea sp.]
MYVCVCNAVTDEAIKQSVKKGHDSLEAIQKELCVGICCGRCKPFAQELIRQCAEQREDTYLNYYATAICA